jgi:hypothetical protein
MLAMHESGIGSSHGSRRATPIAAESNGRPVGIHTNGKGSEKAGGESMDT